MRGDLGERHHLLPRRRHRHRLALRHARRRPRRRLQGLGRHQLRPWGDGDVRRGHVRPGVEPGRDLPPVGRHPADRLAQPSRADHAQRQRRGADGHRPRHRPGDGGACIGLGRPLPRVPAAAPRRAARQGRRLARPRPVPAGRRAAQLRHQLPDAEVGLPEPELGVRRTSSASAARSPATACSPSSPPSSSAPSSGPSTSSPASAWPRGAAASNEKGAVLLGYSPQRLAATNWVAASMLVTLAAILVGPIQGPITPGRAHGADRAGPRRRADRRPQVRADHDRRRHRARHGQLAAPRAQRRLVRVDPHRARHRVGTAADRHHRRAVPARHAPCRSAERSRSSGCRCRRIRSGSPSTPSCGSPSSSSSPSSSRTAASAPSSPAPSRRRWCS